MQPVSQKLKDALRSNTALRALPSLVIEWNHNRYSGIETVDAIPSESAEDSEKDSFPVSSIVEANRPTRGIIKGRTSKATYAYDWRTNTTRAEGGNEGFAAPSYTDRPGDVRYYTTGADSLYKYWSNPQASGLIQNVRGGYDIPEASVFVVYKTPAPTNKIVVGLENTWASPHTFTVQVTTNGTTWNTIATNPTINSDGQIVLYRQDGGAWTPTLNRNNPTPILGVRLNVSDMNKADSFLNVIEIGGRLERDVTEFVESYSSTFSMSESNFISPLGQSSSNTANVTLSNTEGTFDNNNPDSLYFGLIEKNALFTMDLVYHFDDGTTESVREFTMYSDEWSGPGAASIEAELKDFSKFMQEQECPDQLLENITVGEAVWRMCDAIGFVGYNYERRDHDPAANLTYFYSNGEDMVWDVFQQLAEGTQTAIFFDEYGILQIQTREAAYDKYNDPAWTFSSVNSDSNGARLADIEEQTANYEFEANTVNVKYQTTKMNDYVNGWVKMEVVWEPESSLVLRSSNLTSNLPAISDLPYLQITPIEAKEWPYEGMVTVGGELIKYKGKQYRYFNKILNRWDEVMLFSMEEKENVDTNRSNPFHAYKNDFTGVLQIEERGVYWTKPLDHAVTIPNFESEHFWYNTVGTTSWGINGGISHNANESIITLASNHQFEGNRILRAITGEPGYTKAYDNYGVRMRIPEKNGPTGGGGLFFFGGDGGAGYYIELIKSKLFDVPGGPQRPMHGDEVGFFVRRADGTFTRPVKSVPMQIDGDKWYDIDVEWRQGAPSVGGDFIHLIRVYINGVKTLEFPLELGRVNRSGKFGVWLRGNNRVDYEYLYAHDKVLEKNNDDFSTYDRIRGGYASTAFERDFVFGENMNNYLLTGKETSPQHEANTRFYFEEFGPIVHEVREMEVSFEKGPAQFSKFYTSNDSQVVMPYYVGRPYGAKFMLANASRENAVLNGEDQLFFGTEGSVEQKSFIYGRLVYQEEEETHTVTDKDMVRKRGKIETEFSSKWVQSKAEAEKIGDWVLKNWGLGSDEITINAFGNPMLQLGDLVYVYNPEQHMSEETHRYFIVGISSDFDRGLSTSFTLRRSKV